MPRLNGSTSAAWRKTLGASTVEDEVVVLDDVPEPIADGLHRVVAAEVAGDVGGHLFEDRPGQGTLLSHVAAGRPIAICRLTGIRRPRPLMSRYQGERHLEQRVAGPADDSMTSSSAAASCRRRRQPCRQRSCRAAASAHAFLAASASAPASGFRRTTGAGLRGVAGSGLRGVAGSCFGARTAWRPPPPPLRRSLRRRAPVAGSRRRARACRWRRCRRIGRREDDELAPPDGSTK